MSNEKDNDRAEKSEKGAQDAEVVKFDGQPAWVTSDPKDEADADRDSTRIIGNEDDTVE